MSRLFVVGLASLVALACGTSTPTPADVGKADVNEVKQGEVLFPDTGPRTPDVLDIKEPEASSDTADTQSLQCDPGEGCFLDKCNDNKNCQSGWCVQHLGEGVCSQTCQEECPPGWTCNQVAGTDPDVVYICVSSYANLCRPCSTNDNCKSVGGAEDACIDYGADGNFCGGPCVDDGECPWGFSCKGVETVEGSSLQQCVNDTGECPCTDSSVALGLTTPCTTATEVGSCPGKRTCTQDGLSSCDAPEPALEECNGVDDDCDDEIDEPDLVEGNYVNLCNDDNDCTEDKCMGEEGCVNEVLDSGPCEDGDPCTVADHCVAGTCIGDPVECDDGDPCTDDVCTETGGCEYPANSDPCDDGNPCTLSDQCTENGCAGTSVDCECLEDADCGELEDGDLCNGTLVCDTDGLPYQCVIDPGTEVTCPDPAGENAFCLQSNCDPVTGECSFVPEHEGFLCDNADACTVNDKCLEGDCTGGSAVNCNDGNPCTDDSCEAEVGCVHTPNDAPCSDDNPCTTEDLCQEAECVGGPAAECGDGNDCTEDICDIQQGCINLPVVDGACDDGNACTDGDHCEDGVCIFDGPLVCNDGDACTNDSCDPAAGCLFTLNAAPFDDDDICTLADHCHLGECVGGVELICDDGDDCTDDSCNPELGCQFVLNAGPCNDGDPCTVGDFCNAGLCSGILKDCDDDNSCTQDSCDLDGGCKSESKDDGTNCGDGPQWQCSDGTCECVPQCQGVQCGDDQCGGTCGGCDGDKFCFVGNCYNPLTMPDTGQIKCYADDGDLDPCPMTGEQYFGQDANHVGLQMSFTDNGDGTILDNVTGLVWGKCSAGQDFVDCSGPGKTLDWQEAGDYCEQNLDGLPGDGWRMPNRLELLSLTDFQKPYCLVGESFGGEVSAGYWASTTGSNLGAACGVSFGTCASSCSYQKENAQTFFRCVRGDPTSGGDFKNQKDGTVVDAATSLQWQQQVEPQQRNWSDALAYCEDLELAGHEDWRLPNAKESATLVDFTAPNFLAEEGSFGDDPIGGLWTSTTFKSWTSRGFALKSGGGLGDFGDIKSKEYFARCVRSICVPDCAGKECGADGCGGSCENCKNQGQCNAQGMCTLEDENGLTWVTLPGGDFQMGCSPGDVDCQVWEYPIHGVSVASFEILETEVTEEQYEDVIGNNPSCAHGESTGPQKPVECVSWLKAREFCEAVGGRLPTEAEWEYAARGGTTTRYYCGDNAFCLPAIAWFNDNSDDIKHDVAGKMPNSYGLYDTLGNVMEWVEDCHHNDYDGAPSHGFPAWSDGCGQSRTWRGGSWGLGGGDQTYVRASSRGAGFAADEYAFAGFRCARSALVDCTPNCDGKDCGDDGCGGSCGDCDVAFKCSEGQCAPLPLHLWSTSFMGAKSDNLQDVAVDEAGNSYLLGVYKSTTLLLGDDILSDELLENAGDTDMLLVKLDSEGELLWSNSIGGEEPEYPYSLSLDSQGNAYVLGDYSSAELDFGNGAVGNAGKSDVFLAKFSSDGVLAWSRTAGGSDYDWGREVAVLPTGDSYVAGSFKGESIDFGGGPLQNAGGDCGENGCSDFFVSKISSGGLHLWSKSLGGDADDDCFSAVADDDGNIYVGGRVKSEQLQIGDDFVGSTGKGDVLVVKMTPAGEHVWGKAFGGDQDDTLYSLSSDATGNVYLIGDFMSPSIDFGGGPLVNKGDQDIFLVKLDEDGKHIFSRSYGGSQRDNGYSVAVGNDGMVYFTGYFATQTINLGGDTFVLSGSKDLYLAKLDGAGDHIWSRQYGGSGDEWGWSLEIDASDNLLLGGCFRSPTIDFGGGPLAHSNNGATCDIFAAMLEQ